jgi:hypothetical protein
MADKECRSCGTVKPIGEFYLRNNGKLRNECKACWSIKTKQWNENNKPRVAHLHKMKNVERKYGISREEYAIRLSGQQNKCGICEQEFVGTRGPLSPCVDHNHETNEVR